VAELFFIQKIWLVHFVLPNHSYLIIKVKVSNKMAEKKIILVTGGSGLVGQAIKQVTEENPHPDEEFIFLSSKDADLK
jgi:FlaA1/EpsC-like NDP-sugar epimerase